MFANDRGPVGAGAAGSIHAIDTRSGISLMAYSEPAKYDHNG